jgi:CheY-like chemotaxis protein
MESKVILLMEDNARDEALILRALKKSNIVNEVVVARDGVEALDYLFGTGKYSGRDVRVTPQFILLDLKLPEMDGLQVLRKIREDERTRRLPESSSPHRAKKKTSLIATTWELTAMSASRLILSNSWKRPGSWGYTG